MYTLRHFCYNALLIQNLHVLLKRIEAGALSGPAQDNNEYLQGELQLEFLFTSFPLIAL
jgi:hypothetical protein